MTGAIYGEYVVREKVKGSQAIQRKQISLNLPHTVAIQISDGLSLIDPSDITAYVYKRDGATFNESDDPQGILAVTYPISALTKLSVGQYSFDIPAFITQESGIINVVWRYVYNSQNFVYNDFFEMSEYMPTYSALTLDEKNVVDRAYFRFADLYDSIDGGPHLEEEFQTKFSPERMSQLLRVSLNSINYFSQPATHFIVGDSKGTRFPIGDYGLLEWSLYIEIVKHLIRSYTEQPIINGAPIAYLDRRDYTNRWREVLRDEEEGFKKALILFKRKRLSLGGGNLLVAGGMFGNSGAWTAQAGYYTAALRGMSRWYPTSYVVSLPSSA